MRKRSVFLSLKNQLNSSSIYSFLLNHIAKSFSNQQVARNGEPHPSAQFWRLMTRFPDSVGTLPRPSSPSPLGKSGRDGESQVAIKPSSTPQTDKRALDWAGE